MKVLKIKTSDNNFNHAEDAVQTDLTLCGLDAVGDSQLGIQSAKSIEGKITCPDCLAIIRYCKSITID